MKLRLSTPYTVGELRDWMLACDPKKIEMTQTQLDWYLKLLRQQTFDRPLKFRGIPIEVYDEEHETH